VKHTLGARGRGAAPAVTVPRARRVGTHTLQPGEQVGPECPARADWRPAAYTA